MVMVYYISEILNNTREITMQIAICDDDRLCREAVTELVTEYIQQKDRVISFDVYSQAGDLLEAVQRLGSYDIYILDIMMPKTNGIELGMQLRQQDGESKILYLTSSTDFAIAAFKARASDYLLKPAKKEELFAALDDAIATLAEKREKGMVLKTRDSSIKLAFDSILFAQLDKKTVVYHLVNGKTIESAAIRTGFAEAVQELLQDPRFAMCGTSMVVNLYYVHSVENEILKFKSGQQAYLSRRASRELRSVWADFWINGEGSK